VATVVGNTLTVVGVGTTTITASVPGALDASQELTTNPAAQEITWQDVDDVDLAQGDLSVDLYGKATASSGLEITIAVSSGPATIQGTTLALTGERGTVELVAEQNGSDGTATNYQTAQATTSFEVTDSRKDEQTITFDVLDPVTFGDSAFDLQASTTSSLEVQYESSNSAVATVSGSTITIMGAGMTTITATQDGNDDFHPANPVVQELVVNKATPVITFEAFDPVTIDQGTLTLTATTNGEGTLVYSSSDPSVAEVNGSTVNLLSVGTATISANLAESANFISGSVDQDLVINETPLGFESENLLKIYPNPTGDYLKLEGAFKQLNILDSNGKILGENLGGEVIDLVGLPSGSYLLEYIDEVDVRRVIRFIKK